MCRKANEVIETDAPSYTLSGGIEQAVSLHMRIYARALPALDEIYQ